jgi:RNA-binding protein 5/10
MNDGMKHIAQRPTRYLLLRGLDPTVTEAQIVGIFHNLYFRRKEPHNIQRVMLVKDRRTYASWGFAFVEFLDTKVHSVVPRVLWLIPVLK